MRIIGDPSSAGLLISLLSSIKVNTRWTLTAFAKRTDLFVYLENNEFCLIAGDLFVDLDDKTL